MGNITSCAKVRPVQEGGSMPFWKKDNNSKPKEKVDYKARFQHKQYLVSVGTNVKPFRLLTLVYWYLTEL